MQPLDYTVVGRGDSEGTSLPDLHWEMPGRFGSIVLPLDQGFQIQNLIIMVVLWVIFYYPPQLDQAVLITHT